MTPGPRLALILIAALVSGGVTGCVGGPDAAGPTSSPSSSAAASPSPSASEPSASPTPSQTTPPPASGLVALPFTITCEQLMSAQALYDYNPNFGTDPSPRPGPTIAAISDAGGVTCGWLHQTSGERIAAGVIKLEPESLASVQSTAADRGEPAAELGGGVFRYDGGVGHAEHIERDYWVVLESSAFIEPGEAALFLEGMLPALP